jgi:hypothetical protein
MYRTQIFFHVLLCKAFPVHAILCSVILLDKMVTCSSFFSYVLEFTSLLHTCMCMLYVY